MPIKERKIIQIAVDSAPVSRNASAYAYLYALCDDGTVWCLDLGRKNIGWVKEQSIPQEDIEEMEN